MIFLVRHGESKSNAGLPTNGPEDVELTPQGHAQANAIAASFLRFYQSVPSLDLIITSPYSRTKQTSVPTIEHFSNALVEEWDVQEFTYLSSMHHTYSTTEQRKPMVNRYWNQYLPDYEDGPGSESFSAFIKRVHSFMTKLRSAALKHKAIVVFSHQQFISAVLWLIECKKIYISPGTMQDFKQFLESQPIPNAAIVPLEIDCQRFYWGGHIITEHLEQTGHLRQLAYV